jgi:hypothetical protein
LLVAGPAQVPEIAATTSLLIDALAETADGASGLGAAGARSQPEIVKTDKHIAAMLKRLMTTPCSTVTKHPQCHLSCAAIAKGNAAEISCRLRSIDSRRSNSRRYVRLLLTANRLMSADANIHRTPAPISGSSSYGLYS